MGSLRSLHKHCKISVTRPLKRFEIFINSRRKLVCFDWASVPDSHLEDARNRTKHSSETQKFYDRFVDIPNRFDGATYCKWHNRDCWISLGDVYSQKDKERNGQP
jgi:hypothetical protein